jgi:hypothetical protein
LDPSTASEDLDTFSNLSGLQPNYDRCTMLRIGSQKNTTVTLSCSLPIKWSDGEVNILGIHILKERSDLTTIPFNRTLAKIDKILLQWKGKYLSICGKIPLINSLVISQFTFLLMALPTPREQFKIIRAKNSILFDTASQTKLNKPILYNEYDFGGQK